MIKRRGSGSTKFRIVDDNDLQGTFLRVAEYLIEDSESATSKPPVAGDHALAQIKYLSQNLERDAVVVKLLSTPDRD
jgi:hypothetical protein